MAKLLSKKETAQNRPRNLERQRILSENGYNVTIGKPWGPWQQEQWEDYISKQSPFTNKGKGRDQFVKELDNWIKAHPTYKGYNTKDFRNFFIALAGTESGYRKNAVHGTMRGYFQIKDSNIFGDQFKAAFNHLDKLFKQVITKEDIRRAKGLGITQGELLAKYWNQQNRVTNYLHRGVDNQDGLGTSISDYHNNLPTVAEYYDLVPEAITDDYLIVGKGDSYDKYARKIRNSNIDYKDATKSIQEMNNFKPLNIGDTIWINKKL